jgi:glycosyltransferase involved in cell wall biosynthesis
MPGEALRVAILGGVPASLGGGGLEVQIARTRAALAARGHEVFHVSHEPEPRAFDVLHVFSSEPDVWFALGHWRRNPAPMVVSSVCVVAPGRVELQQVLASRVPLAAFAPRMRVSILRRADAVVALTERERRLVRAFSGRLPRVEVIGNGVDPDGGDWPVQQLELPNDFVVLLGTVSPRKRQREAVEILGRAGITAVVVGGFQGPPEDQYEFETSVARAGARWLGELIDPAAVRAVLRRARALLHPSTAEGQSLAVLESMALGTPVVVNPLPSHRELAARYPEYVHFARSLEDIPRALDGLQRPGRPAPVPTWNDVAGRLEVLYLSLVVRR